MKKIKSLYKYAFVLLVIFTLGYVGRNYSIAQQSSQPITKVNQELLLKLVNELREKGCNCGNQYMKPVPPLRWNTLLEKAAYIHVNDMVENEIFSHTGSDGSELGDRVMRLGYKYSYCAENISMGRGSEEIVINAWIKSEGHCINLMHPKVDEIGVARHGSTWALVVGRKLD